MEPFEGPGDTQTDMGLWLLPKVKFEHVSLTSFSRMCVDLAAQVIIQLLSWLQKSQQVLRERIKKSSHKLKEDNERNSKDWVKLINRSGVTLVNNSFLLPLRKKSGG